MGIMFPMADISTYRNYYHSGKNSSKLERKMSTIHNKHLLIFPPPVIPYIFRQATDCA
jgi:hypothetical protein